MLWAAFLMGFFLLLRKSNLVPNNKKSFDAKKQLTRANVELRKNLVKITINWSKTIQFGQRKLSLRMLKIPHSKLCLVTAFKWMFGRIDTAKTDPCFMLPSGEPLSYNMLTYHLRQILKKAGYKKFAKFSGHSFRRGGLETGFSFGLDKKLLKILGDRRSNSYERYLSFPKKQRQKVAKIFKEKLRKGKN